MKFYCETGCSSTYKLLNKINLWSNFQTAARPGFASEFKNISHKCYLFIVLTCLQESGDSKKIGEVYYASLSWKLSNFPKKWQIRSFASFQNLFRFTNTIDVQISKWIELECPYFGSSAGFSLDQFWFTLPFNSPFESVPKSEYFLWVPD